VIDGGSKAPRWDLVAGERRKTLLCLGVLHQTRAPSKKLAGKSAEEFAAIAREELEN
jgi:hypothetical protein